MMSDLEERERAACSSDPTVKVRDEEERIARKLKEEIARIRAMHANKAASTKLTLKKSMDSGGSVLDKEKMLKVSWEKVGGDYTSQRLRDLFEKFGVVEEVLIRSSKKKGSKKKSSKKKGSALIVMASKDAAVVATGSVIWDLSNPLLVKPLQPAVTPVFKMMVQREICLVLDIEEAPKGC